MSLTQSYEPQRDLLTGMAYHRGSTLVAQRTYTYDSLGRLLTRRTARNGQTVNDTFGYNNRSELTTATVNNGSYAYDYDNIGNRKTAQENAEKITSYQSNALNQYTALSVDGEPDFQPEYDADGNQTRVKTNTGIWAITYDTENRPTDFTCTAADNTITTVHCEYDSMGRRAIKRVMVNGNVTLHQRYIYRGYLQIACIDLTRSHHPALWYITWDPTQNIATRPLAIQKDGTWYTYGWDLTKNICEVYGQHGYLRTAYTYTPYGQVAAEGDVEQNIQWSSEFNDTELGLVYYNYRHYNPVEGRWTGRDSVYGHNLYSYVTNDIIRKFDISGLIYTIANEPTIRSVTRSEMSRELGRFDTTGIKIPQITSYFGFSYMSVPDETIIREIKLVDDDNAYETVHLYMKMESKKYSLAEAKEKVKQHELNHFKSFKKRMRPFLKVLNSYDGFSCVSVSKLKLYLHSYHRYVMSQIKLDSVKLDIKDYYGDMQKVRIQEKSFYESNYNKAKSTYEKAKKALGK